MGSDDSTQMVLGLDLGANSVGWALVQYDGESPCRLVDLGARIFEAGVEGSTQDIQEGKDKPRGEGRRLARQQRRQAERRARRLSDLAHTLQRHGLLPGGDIDSSSSRHELFTRLDAEIQAHYLRDETANDHAPTLNQLPYFLRARALDGPLTPHELGRALYHLGQRRGFLSNRKTAGKDKEEGEVKKGISRLYELMNGAKARTLGEYFSRLNPAEERFRGRWTSRRMYEDEFSAIWEAQRPYHPEILTDQAREDIQDAIFFQRKLKSQKHLIGKCSLEDGRKRAPVAILPAQRFRILQRVNDLRVIDADGRERPLSSDERSVVLHVLDHQGEIKFTKLRSLLKLGKSDKFNLERGGEERLVGNRTAAKLRDVFGERWDGFTDKEREQIVEDLRSIEKEEALYSRGIKAWGLDDEKARAFSQLTLENGYFALSRQAIAKLLPFMEQGVQFATAKKQVYGDQRTRWKVDRLPMVDEAPFELRNPTVHRTLTELRRVVNAIITKYGKPDIIRIELARDLKKNRKEREAAWKKNRQNQRKREAAAEKILRETGNHHPRRDDIERVLLAEECNWECPYTGRTISPSNLLGDQSQFDIEHIIPYARCLDNSYMNKTLCYNEENRNRKRNRTPYEAYSEEELELILQRVKRFQGDDDIVKAKLRRFRTTTLEDFETFANRKLNDTRYASTLAAKYLGLLYGGDIDETGRRRIQAARGEVTSDLRWAWGLNKILGDGGPKSRDDHRHHAIDAVVIALTSPGTIKALSEANAKAKWEARRAWWKDLPPPWEGFLNDVRAKTENVIVSHRRSMKVNGPLHEETIYSPQKYDEKGKPYVHVRKSIDKLSMNEVDAIVDEAVREAVQAKLYELGQSDPKKAFADPQNHPRLRGRYSNVPGAPIHSVRIRKNLKTFTIGKGHRERAVVPASNHHMEIIEVTDKKGRVKWDDVIVDQFTAMQRLAEWKRLPKEVRKNTTPQIVQRDHGPGTRFVMSLAQGDILMIDTENDGRRPFIIRSISKGDINYVAINDARLKADIQKAEDWGRIRSMSAFQSLNPQKMMMTPLGELRPAND